MCMYSALFQSTQDSFKGTALFGANRALLNVYMALGNVNRGLLNVYMALWNANRALLGVDGALLSTCSSFREQIGLF